MAALVEKPAEGAGGNAGASRFHPRKSRTVNPGTRKPACRGNSGFSGVLFGKETARRPYRHFLRLFAPAARLLSRQSNSVLSRSGHLVIENRTMAKSPNCDLNAPPRQTRPL